MDCTTWRVRPRERRTGMTDKLMASAPGLTPSTMDRLSAARTLIGPHRPYRPLKTSIGEIYLRSHPDSNQDLVRRREPFGGEVVDASLGEWIDIIGYDRKLKRRWTLAPGAEGFRSLLRVRAVAAPGGTAVNVFSFTCMPSMVGGGTLKPLRCEMKIPGLHTPYGGALRPSRETVLLRTFPYQAEKHMEARTTGKGGKTKT
ncbi:MAG: hypothetical protein ACLGPL_01755 [Acidobacteriota bacterium]